MVVGDGKMKRGRKWEVGDAILHRVLMTIEEGVSMGKVMEHFASVYERGVKGRLTGSTENQLSLSGSPRKAIWKIFKI